MSSALTHICTQKDACIFLGTDMSEYRAKPASEMKRSGIELGHCGDMIRVQGEARERNDAKRN